MDVQACHELSDEELDRMERLTKAASAGPWYACVVGCDTDATSNCIELGSCNELGSFHAIELRGGTLADQSFIASARQDIPKLLAEVRALRKRLDSLCAIQRTLALQPIPDMKDASAPLRCSVM